MLLDCINTGFFRDFEKILIFLKKTLAFSETACYNNQAVERTTAKNKIKSWY